MSKHLFSKIDSGQFTSKDKKLLIIGANLAGKTSDKAHGINHIKAIRDSYIQFRMDNSPKIVPDDRVMAHSIVFHDIYKMLKVRSKNTIGIIAEEAYEGLGSARIFANKAHSVGLDTKLASNVIYAIRKHSLFNILPRITKEARLLFDLDDLEGLNVDRYKEMFNQFKFDINTQIKIVASYLKMRSKMGFYYDWSRAVFDKKKDKFMEELYQLIKKG